MVKSLTRKLLRDLWRMKGQAVAITLVVACGVAVFVQSFSVYESLLLTQMTYYERYRFAEVFGHAKRAPDSLAQRILEIPGVAAVDTRVIAQVTLDVEGLSEPATGKLVSIPASERPRLNDLFLREGRYIEPGQANEVLVSEVFADAHGFEPGDSVTAVINGRRQTLRMVGLALSPEYIYQIKSGDIFPDDKRYGIFWMGNEALASAFNMQGAFNDVTLQLTPGASEEEVIVRLDELLEPYGGLGSYGRYHQVSNRYVSDEIEGLWNSAIFAPSIFLCVAAFLLNVVFTRLISTQREQIAALKALGYSRWQIGFHYLQFVLIIVFIGSLLGTLTGAWLGRGNTEMYTMFYHFPVLEYHLRPVVVVWAVIISLAASVLGVFGAVLKAVRLPPAEAMRPEPPGNYKPTILERIGLGGVLSPPVKIIVRNIERRPLRALFSSLGISFSVAILVMGFFFEDAIDFILDVQFTVAGREDAVVSFVEHRPARARFEVAHFPGVVRAEPFRSVPVRIRFGHRHRQIGLMGLEPDATLHRVVDQRARVVVIPEEGIVMSKILADNLGLRPGDMLTVEVLEGSRLTLRVPVVGLVDDMIGVSLYMNIHALNRLMREGGTISGAFLSVDDKFAGDLYTCVKELPRVAGMTLTRASIESFEDTLKQNMLIFATILIIFAMIITCGVVYNSARVALSERSRELASLRVMGFTRAEISVILLGELACLTLAAIPFGFVLGYLLSWWICHVYTTELYRIPVYIEQSTYAISAAIVLVASTLTALIVRRKLDRLDLVAVLKTRE